ncbi:MULTISPECIES: S8 family peptidase [unclassified Yoonia]|uniref:S8 family peptidase n=1 Tax=unclassified Yoonia TaxID=2629118 RepID=UPI002AFE9E1E|nr:MULTISPECIES: S8 family peptidase [unclassified Yoonia]
MKKLICLVFAIVLGACIPTSDDAEPVTIVVPDPPVRDATDETDDVGHPWNRHFVTSFSATEVQRIRSLPGFLANGFRFTLWIDQHPDYQGFGRVVRSHPLTAARLDYALSTGLTGAGQVVSLIDSGVRLSHDQFTGKTIHISGRPPAAGDFHGTAVASVMAGNGANGGTIGFAPGADLHLGHLNFGAPVSWTTLGNHMRDAAAHGAIVSNNSWGLSGGTVQNVNVTDFVRATRSYIDGLRTFAAGGVIVFALQNDYAASSASVMAALPLGAPDLEANWISVINAIPLFNDDGIQSAVRISTACLETARFCMAANGQIKVATQAADDSYEIGVGASFAAPQVAGSVALLAEAFPDLTAAQLRDRLLATADNRFFEHDAVLEFAPGITHGYNAEFGHGFLDLRAALLPIGQPVVPMADGGTVDLGMAAILAGPAVGDSLTRSLAALDIVTTDQLHGSFAVSGDVLAGTQTRADPAAMALTAALQTDMGAARRNMHAAVRSGGDPARLQTGWHDASGTDLQGGEAIALTAPGDDLGVALLTGEATTGLAVHRSFDLGQAQGQVGFTTLHADGTMLGITMPQSAGDVSSVSHALHIDMATQLSSRTALRMTAEIGVATGQGRGLLGDVSPLVYDRVGVSLARADIGSAGDVLTMFVRQPVAVTRGSASMDLPVQMTSGDVRFARHDIGLAPVERQLDLGFAYQVPVSKAGNLSLGVMHSQNDGNIAGQSAVSGYIGVQFGF